MVSSDAELSCAFSTMNAMGVPVFKFDIVLNQDSSDHPATASDTRESSDSSQAPSSRSGAGNTNTGPDAQTHAHVTCDECGCSPISGVRYKCTVRHDFDLCGACESKVAVQPFPMVKLYIPAQTWCNGRTPQYGRGWARAQRAHAQAHGGSPAPASTGPLYNHSVHHGVQCDECGCLPIHGNRYKCTVRNDFDLCGVCESKVAAQPFPMIKLYTPEQAQYIQHMESRCPNPHRRGGRHGHPRWVKSVLGTGKDVADFAVHLSNSAIHVVADALDGIHHKKKNRGCQGGGARPATGAEPSVNTSETASSSTASASASASASTPNASNTDDSVPGPEAELEVWSDECLQEAIEYSIRLAAAPKASNGADFVLSAANSVASLPEAASTSAFKACSETSDGTPPNMCVAVVTDVTFPSGSLVETGSQFKKIWLVRNSGAVAWPQDTFLRVSPSPSSLLCDADTRVPVGSVPPGEEVQVGVSMRVDVPTVAEGEVRNYINVFCLASERDDSSPEAQPAETVFSDLLFLDVNVGSSESCATAVSTSNIMAAEGGGEMAPDVCSDSVTEAESGAGDGWEVLGTSSPPSAPSRDAAFSVATGAIEVTEEAAGSADETASVADHVNTARWAHELATLGEMGFTDPAVLVPLLVRLVLKSKTELQSNVEQNEPSESDVQIANRAHSEALQAVVMEMLSASGAMQR